MNTFAACLDAAVRARVPNILGVCVGDRTDRSTWRVNYGRAPAPAEEAAVEQVFASFEPPEDAV